MSTDTAFLSSKGRYIIFSWQYRTRRFRGPYSLERIERVKEWDDGYLVVDAKYQHSAEEVEDYIDLVPVLERLYINAKKFLSPIKKVEVRYAG